jgi:O-antigen ligase
VSRTWLRWSDQIGKAALYLLCLTAFLAPAGAEASSVLLLFAFVLAFPRWKALSREPVVVIALLAAVYGVLQTLVFGLLQPDRVGLYLEGLTDWLRLLLFIPFAFFSRGDERRLDVLLLLALLGLLGGMLYRLDWSTLFQDIDAFLYRRSGYGSPALVFALHSGAGLIGLITVGREVLRSRPDAMGRSPLVMGGWILAVVLLLTGLSLTSARSGWLALLAGAPVALWVAGARSAGTGAPRKVGLWLRVSAGLLVAVLLLVATQRTIERVSEEQETLASIVAGEEPAAMTSDAIRWYGLRFGVEMWLDCPLFGWGAGASKDLIESSGRAELGYQGGVWLRHLHNGYLEVLVQFGLVGFILTAAFLLAFVRRMHGLCGAGRVSRRYCGFFAGILVLMLVWSLFDYRVPHRDWRVFWIILAGAAGGFIFQKQPAAESAHE